MELRTTEEEVEKMVVEYKSVCRADERLFKLDEEESASDESANDGNAPPLDAALVLSTLESLQEHLITLQPKMERFRNRLGEKDPITEAPRYGEKTATRVTALLQSYDALDHAIQRAFSHDDSNNTNANDAAPTVIIEDLKSTVEQQKEAARRKQQEQERLRQQQLKEEERQKQALLQEEQERQEEARLALAQEQADLSRRAQAARQARLEAEEREQAQRLEQQRIDCEWMDAIPKGPDGVQQQLVSLKEATKDEPGAYSTAITALHTLFSQIVAHPEQVNFRRVRKAHAQFQQDIGRHDGGMQVLIAAGFRLGAIDDVPCFISTEPNLETQMDEWSEWFDLLKATLEILEQELINA